MTTTDDRERWNARYASTSTPLELRAPDVLAAYEHLLPRAGRALDVAGGTGDAALAMVRRGLETTLVDVSDVALRIVGERGERMGLPITTARADLSAGELPDGPWHAITCIHYLDRDMLPRLGAALEPYGVLIVAIATRTNLERHERPSARFLLDRGELPTLLPELEPIDHVEQWTPSGVHEAWYAGKRPPN